MGKSHALKLVAEQDGPRDHQRADLRLKIEQHAQAERDLAAITRAFEVAEDRSCAAYRALVAAEKAVDLHKPSAGQRLADQLLGAHDDVVSADEAGAALAKARAEDEAFREACEILRQRREAAETELESARFYRSMAIAAVVKASPNIRAVLADYQAANRELAVKYQVLSLFKSGMLPDDARFWFADTASLDPPMPQSAATLAWRAAIVALESDADAPLPEAS